MGIEYKIKFEMPVDYNPEGLFQKLPSPINKQTMTEIYNYQVEAYGFFFVDYLVDVSVASLAFRRFIDEALIYSDSIEITEL